MSFGHGDFAGYRNGRYFQDFKTKAMRDFLSEYSELELLDMWKNTDDFGEASVNDWLHIMARKREEKQE